MRPAPTGTGSIAAGTPRHSKLMAAALAAAIGLVACGGEPDAGPATPTTAPHDAVRAPTGPDRDFDMGDRVEIRNDGFWPRTLIVPAGATVTFENKTGGDHAIRAVTGLFDSGPIPPGGVFSFETTGAISVAYDSLTRPGLRGTVEFSAGQIADSRPPQGAPVDTDAAREARTP